jgi:hypothetical protein
VDELAPRATLYALRALHESNRESQLSQFTIIAGTVQTAVPRQLASYVVRYSEELAPRAVLLQQCSACILEEYLLLNACDLFPRTDHSIRVDTHAVNATAN